MSLITFLSLIGITLTVIGYVYISYMASIVAGGTFIGNLWDEKLSFIKSILPFVIIGAFFQWRYVYKRR